MLRGVLVVGGAFGVWGLHEAATNDLAQAAPPAPSCVLSDLLGVGETDPLATAPHAPGVSADERPAVQALAGDTVDAITADGTKPVVEVVAPVTHTVAGLASPVVEKIAGTGLLEPVGDLVRPVAEPIVDMLPPALAPVGDVLQPITEPPALPATPPGHSAVVAPQPAAGSLPPAAPPSTAPSVAAVYPQASSWAPAPGPAGADEPSKAAVMTQVQRPVGPGDTCAVMPAAPANADRSGSAAGGTGIPADAALRSWAPSLHLLGSPDDRADELVDRSRQPDTRPA